MMLMTRESLEARLFSLRKQQAEALREQTELQERLLRLEGQAAEVEFWLHELRAAEAEKAE